MLKPLAVTLALLPLPALATELWCMPSTICSYDGDCHATTDEEPSIRLHDLNAASSTLRSHVEDAAMTRNPGNGTVEWTGANMDGGAEYLIWRQSDMVYNYTVTTPNRGTYKAIGYCEIQ